MILIDSEVAKWSTAKLETRNIEHALSLFWFLVITYSL
jgi:hypothetical protein